MTACYRRCVCVCVCVCACICANVCGHVCGETLHRRSLIFAPQIPVLLSPRGVLYLVVLPENDPEELTAILGAAGLRCDVAHTHTHQAHILANTHQ